MASISIRYRLTESEFMSACSAHWTAHRQSTISGFVTGGIGIVVALGISGVFKELSIGAAAVGAILIFLTGLRWFLWRGAYRSVKKFCEDIAVTFSDEGLHVENADGISDLKWTYYTWYLDTDKFVLLYATKRSFSVIPKKAFGDQAALDRFTDMVMRNLKKIR